MRRNNQPTSTLITLKGLIYRFGVFVDCNGIPIDRRRKTIGEKIPLCQDDKHQKANNAYPHIALDVCSFNVFMGYFRRGSSCQTEISCNRFVCFLCALIHLPEIPQQKEVQTVLYILISNLDHRSNSLFDIPFVSEWNSRFVGVLFIYHHLLARRNVLPF